MQKHRRIALLASLLSAGALIAAAPASAQMHRGIGGPSRGGPSAARPVHGAAPGHVLSGGPSTGFRGGPSFGTRMTVRPFTFQHHDFAHFTAEERDRWRDGWWHHGWWHGRWGWWWFAGGFWWWYDAPVYPYPTTVSDVYYVEPTYESSYGYWYYCNNPPGYYPYVQYCNGPWQPVPPAPAPGYGGGGPQEGPGDQGPPGYQGGDEQGPPPPGYDQGPPGYNQGPPGYDQGPPGYNEGPPPNSGQGPGYNENQGPPPGNDQGPPPSNH